MTFSFQLQDFPYAWHEHYRLPDMSCPDEYRPPGWSAHDEENHQKFWGNVYPHWWSQRDWEYHRRYLMSRREHQDKLDAWHAVLPRLVELERRRLPLHVDLEREFFAYGGRNAWVYFQAQTRSTREIAGLINRCPATVRELIRKGERRLMYRAKLKPSEWQSRPGRPIDMGGPRDEWLEFCAPMTLRTPDPRVEDLG